MNMFRSMGWQTNENVTNYYKQKLSQIDAPPSRPQVQPNGSDSRWPVVGGL